MPQNLQIVFGYPGEGVSDEEFESWYDEHLTEILSIPGFHSAQRYRLVPAVVDEAAVFPYRHMVVYEVDSDTAALMKAMGECQLGDTTTYAERKETDSSGPPLPWWWRQVRFASFNCIAAGDRHEA
jgi:hypothetical protein